MRQRAASLLALILLTVACASVRDIKSDVVGEYGALTRRGEQVHAQWAQAAAEKRVSAERVKAFNAFWQGDPNAVNPDVALGFKGRFRLIGETLQTSTDDKLPGLQAEIRRLQADLEKWALSAKGGA